MKFKKENRNTFIDLLKRTHEAISTPFNDASLFLFLFNPGFWDSYNYYYLPTREFYFDTLLLIKCSTISMRMGSLVENMTWSLDSGALPYGETAIGS